MRTRMEEQVGNVCGVGAGLHPQGSAEGGAEVAVCEGNSQGTQPGDRASSVSPRYQMKEPREPLGSFILTLPEVRSLDGYFRLRLNDFVPLTPKDEARVI